MGIQLDFVTIWTKMKQKSEKSDIRYKQRSFHSNGVKITDRGDEKAPAPVRFSHESVSKGLVSGWRR